MPSHSKPFQGPLVPAERFFSLLNAISSPLPSGILAIASYLYIYRDSIQSGTFPSLSVFAQTSLGKWLLRLAAWAWLKEGNRWLGRLAVNNGYWGRDRPVWNNEVVIITGGAAGIGAEIVSILINSKPGVKIAVLDITDPEVLINNPNLKYYKCNIAESGSVEFAASDIVKTLGKPTIIINNAGIMRSKTLLELTSKEFDTMQKVNVLGSYNIIRTFLPYLIEKNHGHVVQFASTAGFTTAPCMVDYSCSKAAAISLYEGVGVELKWRYNAPKVKTSVILPIKVQTKLGSIVNDHKNRILTPPLSPSLVASRVVQVLDSGLSQGHVFIPSYLYATLPALRYLPGWYNWYILTSGDIKNFATQQSWERGKGKGYRIWADEE